MQKHILVIGQLSQPTRWFRQAETYTGYRYGWGAPHLTGTRLDDY
jgi:hypothetical protein